MNIKDIIKKIDDLFVKFNKDIHGFTVDYDDDQDALYCHYTPCVNDCGFAVSDYLLYIYDALQDDLKELKNYLDKNEIKSRYGCEWYVEWGWKE